MAVQRSSEPGAVATGRYRTLAPGRIPLYVVLALGLILCSCTRKDDQAASKTSNRTDDSRPNIVLISVDTLRADHLGCYGYQRNTSPHIDQLAAEGALFESTISSTSWTLPAHCALFTGLADTVHGCLDIKQRLAESHSTLAERLKGAGYTTIAFFSGATMHPIFGLAQGFDEYQDCTSYADQSTDLVADGQVPWDESVRAAARADITNPRLHRAVQRWLQEKQSRPFFMFIHMWDVHADYIPPQPYDRMFDPDYDGPITGRDVRHNPAINAKMPARDIDHLVALYDGEIAWTDAHVGKILADLDALGLRDSTIVVLLSDHGEEFFEHGGKGHRQTLFDEVIHVPLIIRYPARIPAGRRYPQQARMIDILPTILALANQPPPTDVMGQSLTPLFTGGTLPQDTLAVSELFTLGRAYRSFRRPDRKAILHEPTGGTVIFNLQADPAEKNPLPNTQSPLAQAMLADMRNAIKWLIEQRQRHETNTTATTLPDQVRQQLESLGYIGDNNEDEPETIP